MLSDDTRGEMGNSAAMSDEKLLDLIDRVKILKVKYFKTFRVSYRMIMMASSWSNLSTNCWINKEYGD